jgi:hypothetical protein
VKLARIWLLKNICRNIEKVFLAFKIIFKAKPLKKFKKKIKFP